MYKALADSAYTSLRKRLLGEKGSNLQREFLEELVAGSGGNRSFCAWFREQVPSEPGEATPLLCQEKLTEYQYKAPSAEIEAAIYEPLKALAPADACQPTFWGEATLRHIEEEYIEARYLAAGDGKLSGGRSRVEKALKAEAAKEIDDCVRTVLRRLSGLPERGHRSVYVNCPFGRAWWRMRLCEEVSQNTRATKKEVLGILRVSQGYWEEIVTLAVLRDSMLGKRKMRDLLLWCLAETHREHKGKHQIFTVSNLRLLRDLLKVRIAEQKVGQSEIRAFIEGTIRSLAGA